MVFIRITEYQGHFEKLRCMFSIIDGQFHDMDVWKAFIQPDGQFDIRAGPVVNEIDIFCARLNPRLPISEVPSVFLFVRRVVGNATEYRRGGRKPILKPASVLVGCGENVANQLHMSLALVFIFWSESHRARCMRGYKTFRRKQRRHIEVLVDSHGSEKVVSVFIAGLIRSFLVIGVQHQHHRFG
ncbi:hypothetical protein D3C84_791970 [compost metagenome]